MVEIRVAFESHTFTAGCLMAEAPHIQYSSFPHDHGLRPNEEYWVFFDVRPAKDHGAVVLRVQSAYVGDTVKPRAGRTAKKIGFAVLVSKALAGKRAKPPP